MCSFACSVPPLPQCKVGPKPVGAAADRGRYGTQDSFWCDFIAYFAAADALAYLGPPHQPGVPPAHRLQLLHQLLHLPGQAWGQGYMQV